MESETALIRTDSGIELNSVSSVNLNLTVVINPRNTELNESLRLDDTVNYARLDNVGTLFDNRLKRFKNLSDSLKEFGLVGVALAYCIVYALEILTFELHIIYPSFIEIHFDNVFYHTITQNASFFFRCFKKLVLRRLIHTRGKNSATSFRRFIKRLI